MPWEEIFQFQDSQDIRLVKSNNKNNQNISKFKQLQFNRILLKISGVTLMEQTITKRRPGYIEYIQKNLLKE